MSEQSYVNSLFVIVSGPTYIWTFNLKTKEKSAKWVLAGVALLLQIWFPPCDKSMNEYMSCNT